MYFLFKCLAGFPFKQIKVWKMLWHIVLNEKNSLGKFLTLGIWLFENVPLEQYNWTAQHYSAGLAHRMSQVPSLGGPSFLADSISNMRWKWKISYCNPSSLKHRVTKTNHWEIASQTHFTCLWIKVSRRLLLHRTCAVVCQPWTASFNILENWGTIFVIYQYV